MRPLHAAALLAGAAILAGCSEATTRSTALEPEDWPNRLTVASSFIVQPSVLGLVDEIDGRPVFIPCGRNVYYEIAEEDGWPQIARAWAAEGGLPGAPVLMDIAMELQPRRSPDGAMRHHVIPAGLMRLEPRRSDCPNRPAALGPLRAAG